MAPKKLFLICCLIMLSACSTAPKYEPSPITEDIHVHTEQSVSAKVLESAYSWLGTPYRYGGTTKYGMDCSGLVYQSYSKVNINLPRSSFEQARAGKKIPRRDAQPGDLIFFRTSGRRISHVGIINQVKGNTLSFIHSSESKGVIISSLDNAYWKQRYVQINRILFP